MVCRPLSFVIAQRSNPSPLPRLNGRRLRARVTWVLEWEIPLRASWRIPFCFRLVMRTVLPSIPPLAFSWRSCPLARFSRGNAGIRFLWSSSQVGRDAWEFRISDLKTPLASLQFEVWKIAGHSANHGQRDWWMGGRQGPHADGASAASRQTPPPGLRRAGFRGKLEVQSHPGQMGYPAPMDADVGFECSIKGYQSATLAFQSCESQKSLLGGQAPRETGADENQLAQRAKVGSCAACARFTHSGAPLSRESRSFDPQMACGVKLSAKFGPWGGRRPAAHPYNQDNGYTLQFGTGKLGS